LTTHHHPAAPVARPALHSLQRFAHWSSQWLSHTARVRALQLLCVAAVAAAGMSSTAGVDSRAGLAEVALRMMTPVFQPQQAATDGLQAAMDAAGAGLSQVEVIVRRNDTLDQIFRRLELSVSDLANLRAMQGLKSALDRLKPGEQLTLAHRDGILMGLERRLSPSELLKVRRTDPAADFVAKIEETPLQRVTVTARGEIRSSLFQAGTEAGLRDPTTLALAEIFGWDIDFALDLRTGDEFAVTYEKLERDGEAIGDGAILAARFINDGRVFEAVRYVAPDGHAGYYTPDGASLRKAFLKSPVEFTRISSVFNPKRRHPILNRIRAHNGIDYAAPSGTPVRAAGDGRVAFRGVKGGYGNVVEIEHAGRIVTRYGHLSRFAKGLTPGRRIGQGDVIAYVGSTGLATGPHLHFEYMVKGAYQDPRIAMRSAQAAEPLSAKLMTDFRAKAEPLLAALDAGRHDPALDGLQPQTYLTYLPTTAH
jgi:murein DD-endopeptidase MepM/ murein hydrolase activator NlpD